MDIPLTWSGQRKYNRILCSFGRALRDDHDRSRREVSGDSAAESLTNFQKTFNNDREEEPKGNLYMRMFGR